MNSVITEPRPYLTVFLLMVANPLIHVKNSSVIKLQPQCLAYIVGAIREPQRLEGLPGDHLLVYSNTAYSILNKKWE